MSSRQAMEALDWSVSVDDEAGELRLDHPEADSSYVLDEDGSLRVPGNGEVGDDLQALRQTLTEALEDGSSTGSEPGRDGTGGSEAASDADGPASLEGGAGGQPQSDDGWTAHCDGAIACRQGGSHLKMQPTSRLEIDAPTLTISANVLEIESNGNATIDAAGSISLDGSLIELN